MLNNQNAVQLPLGLYDVHSTRKFAEMHNSWGCGSEFKRLAGPGSNILERNILSGSGFRCDFKASKPLIIDFFQYTYSYVSLNC